MKSLEEIKNKFGEQVEVFHKSKRRIYVTVPHSGVKELVRFMVTEQKARLSIATAVDQRAGIEILYHLAYDRDGVMVSVRTMVAKPELRTETITDFLPGANWIEREIHEMFGINFIGHPNLERLLLPDDWVEGVYPLRKKTFESEQENLERK